MLVRIQSSTPQVNVSQILEDIEDPHPLFPNSRTQLVEKKTHVLSDSILLLNAMRCP